MVLLALAGCGPDADPGPWVGQEIWITYHSPEHAAYGTRTGLSREEARSKAEGLRRRVLDGEDIGVLARKHSNAPGGAAFGFTGWVSEEKPDERGRALMKVRVGEVTEIVDWLGGFQFAKRVSADRGRELEASFEREMRRRAKFLAIVFFYKGQEGLRYDDVVRLDKGQALALARGVLDQAVQGADFGDLARVHSQDPYSRERGGLVKVEGPDRKETEWVRPQQPTLPVPLLDAVFSAEVGRAHPEPVVTDRGIFLIKVLARVD